MDLVQRLFHSREVDPWRDSMRRSLVLALAVTLFSVTAAQAQVGMPGIEYANTVAAGDGVQLYPYDQQDPWLHGYFQRYPAYGGFASFRPYNYRHVFSQTQIATGWGSTHGMPYSQQFWNKYRGSYLDQNLHSETESQPLIHSQSLPVYPASAVRPIGYESIENPQFMPAAPRDAAAAQPVPVSAGTVPRASIDPRPVHIFPQR